MQGLSCFLTKAKPLSNTKNKTMQKNDFTVDIHHHITLRVMNTATSKEEISYWQPKHNTIIGTAAGNLIRQQTKDIAKVSQTNLYAAAKGNVKILFDSLYPMEDGFFRMESLSQRLVGKKNADTILRTITGMSENRLKEIRKNTDYFSKLQEHYECLLQAKGSSPDGKYRLEISKNYEHLQKIMQEQENTLVIVPTIEGLSLIHI